MLIRGIRGGFTGHELHDAAGPQPKVKLHSLRESAGVQLEMRVKFFQTLPSGACQQPARERLGKIVFQRDDIQNRSDRFRDIRGIRGRQSRHEFHELTRIEFFDSFCRDEISNLK